MSWDLWFWLWSCNRPGENLFSILFNIRVYHPDVPVPSHLYGLTIGFVRDETDVLACVCILVEYNSVVVVNEVRHGRENFVHLSDLKCSIEFLSVLSVKVEVCLALILDAVRGG